MILLTVFVAFLTLLYYRAVKGLTTWEYFVKLTKKLGDTELSSIQSMSSSKKTGTQLINWVKQKLDII